VQAEIGIEKLRSEVDTLIVIPNDRLLSISDRNVSVLDAFKAADQVLLSGVQGITDLITTPGLINLDFADVKSVMSGAGSALMGTGSSRGDDRAVAAAEMAISSPLLEASIDGAHGVLLSIQGGSDLGLFEINEAAQLVANSAAVDANIIFGAVIDDALGDEVRVTVIAAGLGEGRNARGSTSTASSSSSYSAGAGIAASQGVSTAGSPSAVSAGAADGAATGSAGAAPWYTDVPAAEAGSAEAGRSGSEGFSADPDPIAAVTGNDTFAGSDTAMAPAGSPHAAVLSAPVPDDRPAAAEVVAVSYSAEAYEVSQPEAPRPDRVPATAANAAGSSAFRLAHAETVPNTAKTFDVPATRRRPVVFEEDDDLDIPDFLK
jgi:cell division protein FtsZ